MLKFNYIMRTYYSLEVKNTASIVDSCTSSEDDFKSRISKHVQPIITKLTEGVNRAPAYAQSARKESEYIQRFLAKASLPTKDAIIREAKLKGIPVQDELIQKVVTRCLDERKKVVVAELQAGLNRLRNKRMFCWSKPKLITDCELKQKIYAVYKRQCKFQKHGTDCDNIERCKNSAHAMLEFLLTDVEKSNGQFGRRFSSNQSHSKKIYYGPPY